MEYLSVDPVKSRSAAAPAVTDDTDNGGNTISYENKWSARIALDEKNF